MFTFSERLELLKRLAASIILTTGLIKTADAAYTVPDHYKGNCPTGYYNLITEPADVPTDYGGAVIEYALPSNVCVRRLEDRQPNLVENFSREHLIVIDGRDLTPFVPFASGAFDNWQSYEPLLGHYRNGNTPSYPAANNPNSGLYRNYSGVHPVLVSKDAKAVLTLQNGVYLFDKQTHVKNRPAGFCPDGYSTVGDSTTCYSMRNGLRLNSFRKVELIELKSYGKLTPDQECPLGYALAGGLGPSRGICTAVRALLAGATISGIPVAKGSTHCVDGTRKPRSDSAICLPDVTAVYCDMDENARAFFQNYPYRTGRHVFYWPTVIVGNGGTELIDNSHNLTTGTVAMDDLRRSIDLFSADDGFIHVSPLDHGRFPVFHLHSGQTCDQLWSSGGWSMEPIPTFW